MIINITVNKWHFRFAHFWAFMWELIPIKIFAIITRYHFNRANSYITGLDKTIHSEKK